MDENYCWNESVCELRGADTMKLLVTRKRSEGKMCVKDVCERDCESRARQKVGTALVQKRE